MLNYHELFFRWLNFFILCVIVYMLFKKYLYPHIIHLIQNEATATKELHVSIEKDHRLLAQEYTTVQQQKEYCTRLIQASTQWQNAVTTQLDEQKKLHALFQDRFIQKQQQQYRTFILDKNYKQLLPEITHTLEHELAIYFQDTEHQQHYLQQIFKRINAKDSHD